jgi:ribonuclease BN (tRNA processing enzyme)
MRIGSQSIVFSGDQNGSAEAFVDFAHGTDVLVMHLAVLENTSDAGRKLRAPPSIVGRIAAESGAGKLVLSHFTARSLDNMEENLGKIRSRYSGLLVSTHDLDCIEFCLIGFNIKNNLKES